jgi:hypothetical protein
MNESPVQTVPQHSGALWVSDGGGLPAERGADGLRRQRRVVLADLVPVGEGLDAGGVAGIERRCVAHRTLSLLGLPLPLLLDRSTLGLFVQSRDDGSLGMRFAPLGGGLGFLVELVSP